ncbi:MAG: hypothetical protein LBJ63_10830 [Prevotellaceae bacterium]|jgi:hypothetical protein|nr:hypothetical protein [Prevotellaceae bacterium]
MIELLIDDKSVDIDQKTNVAITLSLADIENVEESNTGHSKTFSIPMTPGNRIIFGFVEQVFSSAQFNNAKHTAKILSNGMTVMSGYAQITEYKNNNKGSGVYSLNIIGDGFDWLVNAQQKMNELDAPFSLSYIDNEVYANSIIPITESPLIRFIPIDRGAFYSRDTNGELSPRTNLILQDYYPFINIWRLLELIMSGYTIVSSLESKLKNQYISGQLTEPEDMESIKENNDFFVGTTYESDWWRSVFGELFTYFVFNTWTYDDKYFTTGDILKIITSSFIRFKPVDNIKISFDIELSFQCDPRKAFADTFVFGDGDKEQTFTLANTPVETETEGFNADGYLHYLSLRYIGTNLDILLQGRTKLVYVYSVWQTCVTLIDNVLTDRWFVKKITVSSYKICLIRPEDDNLTNSYFLLYDSATDTYHNQALFKLYHYSSDDFALTYKYALTTKSYSILKGDYINLRTRFKCTNGLGRICFGNECTIKPDFKNNLGYGEQVTIGTVGGEKTQIEFIQALRQMYNLIFYTNSLTKQVFIEPRQNFYIDKL